MKILVIGSGGREHALVWKIKQSKLVDEIFCAPGNGGISEISECIDIKQDNVYGLLDFAKKERIDLTIVGPEAPLALGIVDEFRNYDLKIFGPNKKASQLEASKVFAKEFMAKHNIPTANFKVFSDANEARKYIKEIGAPCVIKADGLAAGKGVIVAKSIDEANDAVKLILEDKVFGLSGQNLIVEECLEGQEASIIVVTDSKEVASLATSQDHKRVFDHDLGPNTGGMGAYSPALVITNDLFKEIQEKIIHRTIDGLVKEGIDYSGVLYAGIMLTRNGPKVLEFNVRFGDPETEAIIPRLKSDLLELMLAVTNKSLNKIVNSGGLIWDNRACVCVVCASGGYPGEYEKDKEIFGLCEVDKIKDVVVFHAGTLRLRPSTSLGLRSGQANNEFKYVTNGGRVLGVTGLGNNIKEAINKTYEGVSKINFNGMHFRRDIGYKAINDKFEARNPKF